MKKNILVIYSASNNSTYLDPLYETKEHTLHFKHYNLAELERLAYTSPREVTPFDYRTCLTTIIEDSKSVDGLITSQDYPGCLIASLVAEKRGFTFPSPKSVLACQHKYYFRELTQYIIPEATPSFTLIDQNNVQGTYDFPLFVKPIKASFSRNAKKIYSKEELEEHCQKTLYDKNYLTFFNDMFQHYTDLSYDANFLIGETPLEGNQVSLEGFVSHGQIHVLGILDALMYPNTLCFSQFSYPSTLPQHVQDRMHVLTKKVIAGLGLDNTLFSIELIYNAKEDSLFIVEINPRISPQFADIFHKVIGTNSYAILLDLAIGKSPSLNTGNFHCAASFPIRLFEDQRVLKIPSKNDIEKVTSLFPDAVISIIAEEGKLLSEKRQDGNSYLYIVINIGAQNFDELAKKRDTILAQLPFIFESVHHH